MIYFAKHTLCAFWWDLGDIWLIRLYDSVLGIIYANVLLSTVVEIEIQEKKLHRTSSLAHKPVKTKLQGPLGIFI